MVINRRIALSFLTIVGVLTLVVGITLAQFTDQVTLAGNTLTTGSADLGLGIDSEDCSTTSDAISGVTSNEVMPGDSDSKEFCIKNNGDEPLAITAEANKTGGSLDPNLVDVKIDCGDGEEMVVINGAVSGDIVTLEPDEVASCTITQTLDGEATTSAQNKSITYDVVFTGTPSGT